MRDTKPGGGEERYGLIEKRKKKNVEEKKDGNVLIHILSMIFFFA